MNLLELTPWPAAPAADMGLLFALCVGIPLGLVLLGWAVATGVQNHRSQRRELIDAGLADPTPEELTTMAAAEVEASRDGAELAAQPRHSEVTA